MGQHLSTEEGGGLGVKHNGRFNLSLLSKWKWRILNDNNYVWYEFLRFKYKDIKTLMLEEPVFNVCSKVSLWWKDLCSVGKAEEENQDNWFVSSIS